MLADFSILGYIKEKGEQYIYKYVKDTLYTELLHMDNENFKRVVMKTLQTITIPEDEYCSSYLLV